MHPLHSFFIQFLCFSLLYSKPVLAGAQREETLAANVASAMSRSVTDIKEPYLVFQSPTEGQRWLSAMSARLSKRIPDAWARERLLTQIQYEASRAGLDPQMVLGLIQVESNFRPYAISSVGAKGLMQVMPFWVNVIGTNEQNLFDVRTNLRYGCTILRHYLDRENGNLFLALGRYNGSRGKATYPDAVMQAWRSNWTW
ncbi:MAG: transglycosylase SLT domain-containing protein [Neisseriaceae bacterium]|nr:transglycosylase SLT domain-containing protein [Neisseriaceae bacterium]